MKKEVSDSAKVGLGSILFTLSVPLWGGLSARARPSGLAEAGLKAGCGLKGRPTQAQQRSTANAEDAALGRLSEQYRALPRFLSTLDDRGTQGGVGARLA